MDTADEHYEDQFEFPLWKLIQERAGQKDISYLQAAMEVLPEYEKGIRYRDTKFEQAEIGKRRQEMADLANRQRR